MNEEILSVGITLSREISQKKIKIDDIKKDIDSLNKYPYKKMPIETSDFSYFSNGYQEKNTISLQVDKEDLIKFLKKDLYIQENLLKKYELEFKTL